jgi:bacteriocin biosynthesis cyclodehydratase domain-containing protein
MPIDRSQRLRIPSHYYVYCDPPDKAGDEALHFISPNRRIKLKGHSFREFVQHVVPMLDGHRTFPEIHAEVSDLFAEEDLATALELLGDNGLLEAPSSWKLDEPLQERLRPQLNMFHDLSRQPWELQESLRRATVAVFGLTGAGVACARSLGAAGLGTLRCVDDGVVAPSDLYFSPEFQPQDCGALRCDALRRHLACEANAVTFQSVTESLADDRTVEQAVTGSDFIVNCMDEGNLSLVYKLNRACLRSKVPWTSASSSSFEVVVGPTVYPGETACYMCYRMRLVAATDNPEASFDFESFLDRRKTDDSGRRANLVFGSALAGQLAGIETFKALCIPDALTTRGRTQVMDLRDFSAVKHVVLRKPWCPACLADWDREAGT